MNWLEYFVQIAQVVKQKSKDRSTTIGAVIVGEGKQIISTGYNSFPRGIDDHKEERYDRPEKYQWTEHAERNAIYNAARSGVSTEGTTMVLSCGLPCTDCARGIIQAGIKRVYCLYSELDPLHKRKHWRDKFIRSEQMLSEAGVKVIYYTPETIKRILL
jgi:dCMP deaminase